jgi:hypothetical protein
MTELPDRRVWDSRTESYMHFPGIAPVQIEVGTVYEIVYVDLVETMPVRSRCTVLRANTFKTTGRRWTVREVAPKGYVGCTSFLWEKEILEQNVRELIVGMPWNYPKFKN